MLDQYAKVAQLRQMQQEAPLRQQALQQNVQAGAQDIAAKQDALATQQATRAAYAKAVKPNAQGQPEIDIDALTQNLAQSGHGDAIPGILDNVTKFQKSKADLTESQQKIQTYNQDTLGYAAKAIQNAKYDPNVAHTLLKTLPDSPQIQQLQQLADTNPTAFKQIVDNAVSQSPAQQKAAEEEKVATIRAQGKPPEGELPLGDKVGQLNDALNTRWSVLNPGKPLPPQFTLPANATQKDYDRINSSLKDTENAIGTKAQRDSAQAARDEAAELRRQNELDKKEKEGIQPVTGTDPKTGRDVLVPMSQAHEMGLQNITKADADIVNKSTAARHWLTLADKPGTEDQPADKQGIIQLIDKMDKKGELGVVASRWNEFLSGKVGAGDPDYTALRAKLGLGATKLMQAHVGSRGGSFMMEHFEDLANGKKMDAANLRAGILSELDYMRDVGMAPDTVKPSGGGGASGGGKSTNGDWASQFGGVTRKQ